MNFAPMIQGQLNSQERELIRSYLLMGNLPPQVAVEVGTWLGGGSTMVILREFCRAGVGHLWGVEADKSIYDQMIANLRAHIPETLNFFTPIFGTSQKKIPEWLASRGFSKDIDFIFLDGGDSPREQVDEFLLLAPYLRVGGSILSHDANFRKGKWFVPFIKALDNYEVIVHQVSEEGMLSAVKLSHEPTASSRARAEKILQKCRMEPVEMFGHLAPRWMLQVAAKFFPRSLVRRFGQGRK